MTLLLRQLARCSRGAAAAEMALVLPILLILLFGSVEAGTMFMSHHAIEKGVRDGARYAARVPLGTQTDDGCVLAGDTTTQEQIKRVTRTGNPDEGETSRLYFWTDDDTVTLSISCTTDAAWSTDGVYADFDDGAPVITVSASVPYPGLFGWLPFVGDGVNLTARSQAAVFGA